MLIQGTERQNLSPLEIPMKSIDSLENEYLESWCQCFVVSFLQVHVNQVK